MEEAIKVVVDAGLMASQGWIKWSPSRLAAFREHVVKLSPEAMAEEAEKRTGEQISGYSIRRWESGKHLPNIKHVVALCNAFEVEIGLFLEAEEEPAPKGKRKPRQ